MGESRHDQRDTTTAPGDPVRGWKIAGLVALAAIVALIPLAYFRGAGVVADGSGVDATDLTFVGRERCIDCHQAAYEAWRGSHHDLSMAVATEQTVLGDFDDASFEHHGVTTRFYRRGDKYFIHTDGPGGATGEFEVTHTFGVEPLQQYLVPLAGGRLQAFWIAWDVERQRWFHLYPNDDIPPDDWLHWTRNGQNWNGMCAECHSTNLRKNYNPEDRTFATSWSEIDVSCEACHGPGSRHVSWAEIAPMGRPDIENDGLVLATTEITARQQVELCAPCHSRRTELGDYDHTRVALLDSQLPSLLREGLYHADGQILEEVYVYGSFVQSKMFHNDVRCSDCHDVHSLKLHADGNELCLRCHRADAYDSYDHHFHQKFVDGKPSDGALCVKCHMPQRPYMIIDWRADHSLRVPRPDLTIEIGTPNACAQSGCHDDRSDQWTVDAYRKWYGLAQKPHYGTVMAAGRSGEAGAGAQLARLAEDPLYPAIVRATALSMLERFPGEASRSVLRRLLQDEDALLRYTAVAGVREADPTERVELVAPLLFDSVKAVRTEAASRLAGVPEELLRPYQRVAYDSALAEYIQSMQYSLDFAFAGHNLGNLYSNLGRTDRAEHYYRLAIDVDELFFPAKVNLAMLLNQEGRNEEAARLLGEVVDAHPAMVEHAYSLGLLLVEMGRHEDALEYLRRGADGMPDRPRASYNLGLLLQELGRDAEAEAALRQALATRPEDPDFLYALAQHYTRRGRWQDARAVAERLIAAHPDARFGHELKAQAERMLRRP